MTTDRLAALFERVQNGPILQRWHWLAYNFTAGTEGFAYFAPVLLGTLERIDRVIPGYANTMLTRIEQLGGREKDQDHYNAIMQTLAEIVVVANLTDHAWPAPATFVSEPTAPGSAKNPELAVTVDGVGTLGVEVKCPVLLKHIRARSSAPWQMVSRSDRRPEGEVTLPKDNPVKDFMVSADSKFAAFKAQSSDFRSVLVIVWDDYVNEPLGSLLAPASGLLTENSFHRDSEGRPVTYPNIDAVVIIRHLHQLYVGANNEPPFDERDHFLDYGSREKFPPHVIIDNPSGQSLDSVWTDALQVWPLSALSVAAEYNPGELIMWLGQS